MPRYSDDIDLYKVDRATDAQLRMLGKLRRANGSDYRGDFEGLSKGEAGRLIRSESSILKQQQKYRKEEKRRYGR
jgi:hypothetical protein